MEENIHNTSEYFNCKMEENMHNTLGSLQNLSVKFEHWRVFVDNKSLIKGFEKKWAPLGICRNTETKRDKSKVGHMKDPKTHRDYNNCFLPVTP